MRMLLLTAFGLGYLTPGPGTWGSLPTVIIVAAALALGASRLSIDITLIALLLVFSVICIAWVPWAEQVLGQSDPPRVVADEVAGVALTLLALPWKTGGAIEVEKAWLWNAVLLVVGFALFRLFDITKPPPVRLVEQIPGGWGLLLDDLVAAVYALIVTQLVARVALPAVWNA